MSKNIKSEPKNVPNRSEDKPVKNEPEATETADTIESDSKQDQTAKSASNVAATGSTAAKRSFIPNLGAKRAEKDSSASKSEQTSQKKERKPFVPNLANRGRNTRSSNLIQSHSIFEAGPAESTKRFGVNDTSESYSKSVGPSGLAHSSSSNRQMKSETADNYIKVEHSLLIVDSKEDLSDIAYVNLKFETKDFLNDIDIEVKRNESETQLVNLFSDNDKEKLVLLQMPDNLNLNEMSEGRIGKIKVYKSGRIELCLNEDKYLNVCLSVAGPFLQEAVTLEISNPEQQQFDKIINNKMINLGQIDTKLVCSPVL